MSNGVSELTCVIFREVYAFAHAHGIRELVAVVSLPVERIFRRLGLPIERLGHRQAVDLGAVGALASASIWMSASRRRSPNLCWAIIKPAIIHSSNRHQCWQFTHKKSRENRPGIKMSLRSAQGYPMRHQRVSSLNGLTTTVKDHSATPLPPPIVVPCRVT